MWVTDKAVFLSDVSKTCCVSSPSYSSCCTVCKQYILELGKASVRLFFPDFFFQEQPHRVICSSKMVVVYGLAGWIPVDALVMLCVD